MDNSLSKEATDWREGRRLRAFELNQQGWSQQRIAEALGVSKGAVSQWMKRARHGGEVLRL
jgi:predicted transcriptional regulator